MPQPPLPDAGFDRVAPFYDALVRVIFGSALHRAQRAALAALPAGSPRVLIIGGGSGWVLGEVLRLRPTAHVLYLEASPLMLTRTRQVLAQLPAATQTQVELRLGTEATLQPDEQFDALVTFFFLDLFAPERLQAIVQQLDAARAPGAPWLVADFRPPTRWWQRGLVRVMYWFFRLTTGISGRQLPDLPTVLRARGLSRRTYQRFYGQLVEAAVYAELPASE